MKETVILYHLPLQLDTPWVDAEKMKVDMKKMHGKNVDSTNLKACGVLVNL